MPILATSGTGAAEPCPAPEAHRIFCSAGPDGPQIRIRCASLTLKRGAASQTDAMPPTTDDRCDWCHGPLTEADLVSPLGQALGAAEAGACSGCVSAGNVLRPPDSLYPDDVELSGPDAWHLAVATLLPCQGEASTATSVLRRTAGY